MYPYGLTHNDIKFEAREFHTPQVVKLKKSGLYFQNQKNL